MSFISLTVSPIEKPGMYGVPVAVEVIDTELRSQWMEAQAGSAVDFEVPPGSYLVRAHLPDGELLTSQVTVSEQQPAYVDLRQEQPVAASQATRFLTAVSAPEWADAKREVEGGPPDVSFPPEIPAETWLLLWRLGESGWESVEWQPSDAYQDEAAFRFVLVLGQQLHLVQIGGPQVPWTFMALPDEVAAVEISPPVDEDRFSIPIDVRVTTERPDVDAFLSYLAVGDFQSAQVLTPSVMAERMLQAKIAHPRAAALGAYYLLRVGDLERLHGWANNLAAWMPWLPDGPIIHAWQLMRQPQPDYGRARSRLLEAAGRGIPVYTEGVRLLLDGLRLFADEDPDDGDVGRALDRVVPYAAAAVWSTPATTFRGAKPEEPSRKLALGVPDDGHLVHLG